MNKDNSDEGTVHSLFWMNVDVHGLHINILRTEG